MRRALVDLLGCPFQDLTLSIVRELTDGENEEGFAELHEVQELLPGSSRRRGLLLPKRPDPEDVAARVQELLDDPVKY